MQRRPTASVRAHSSGNFCSCRRRRPSAQVSQLSVCGGDLLLNMRRCCRLDVHLPPPSHSLPLWQPPSKSLRRLVWVSSWGAVMWAHHQMTQHSLSTWHHERTQHSLSLDPRARPLLPLVRAPQKPATPAPQKAAVAVRPAVAQVRWPMLEMRHACSPPRPFFCPPPALGCFSACDPLLLPPLPLPSVVRVQGGEQTQQVMPSRPSSACR